ncbi:MAG: 2-dehydro-3-deoxyphosphogluconate aldolase / (4S)-4-hydroxy-2-oxoglutarate aldolase [Actinomycetota bacterium]|jgi:2-dehydro-3-deoxyphosphogluconate aldolase/(4S)-4-hydroxy-2-oxoglutarate aldolase|nr:2-dehydro-3-deoxyphosphogluconate aldolase / (4S)-4-hydroxy-2-oxoglutarate aldolase [Actinomycetota bacterium]
MNQKLFQQRSERLREATAIAIFRTYSAEQAVEGVGAAVRGGFEAVEVTMNTPDATDAMAELAGRTDSILGAGTIVEADQVKQAYDAGAEFIVTPIVAPEVVEAAHELSLPVALGASTPTEIFTARRAGADWVKVFPGESLGGPNYVAHVLGPLDGTPILVTGGLTAENYLGYLDAGAELVGFGGSVFDPEVAAEGRYDELERRAIEVCRRLDSYLTDRDS